MGTEQTPQQAKQEALIFVGALRALGNRVNTVHDKMVQVRKENRLGPSVALAVRGYFDDGS